MDVSTVLRWLLSVLQNAREPFATPADADYHGLEGIEVTIRGSRFRITVEAI